MKKILLSIAFAFMGITSSFAAKAYSGPITVIQSDGTELTVYLHGDEHFNWLTTADGALIKQEGNSYYIAKVNTDGSLKATKFLAHNADNRPMAEAKAIKSQNKEQFYNSAVEKQAATSNMLKSMGTGNSGSNYNVKYFPHTGSPKALVILVEFSDIQFQSGKKAKGVFEHYLKAQPGDALPDGYEAYTASNKYEKFRNYGSVSQYFYDMSQGAYTPQFDVVGPYKLGNPSSYYGKGKYDNVNDLVKDACTEAYKDGVDFSKYDADNDGNVDLVYVIYAGYPASMSSDESDIWPKSGYSQTANGFCTFNDKHVNRYGIHAELNWNKLATQQNGYMLSGIGLFCHEFSHTLGLPDLYPTIKDSQVDNQNPEMWDLMDGGEYTYNGGYSPTPYSPWEMENMGWKAPIELEDKAQTISMESYDKNMLSYKIKGENNEYLLLQNIQPNGWWYRLAHKYNSGLLVWRIDYDNKDVNAFDNPNNTMGKPKVTIVPADGYIISDYTKGEGQEAQKQYDASLAGDPFPGSNNVKQLLSVTLNKSTLNKPFYNIAEDKDAGVITFDYLEDLSTGIDTPITHIDANKDARIYTLDGRYLGTETNKLGKGIYIINKKKVVIK